MTPIGGGLLPPHYPLPIPTLLHEMEKSSLKTRKAETKKSIRFTLTPPLLPLYPLPSFAFIFPASLLQLNHWNLLLSYDVLPFEWSDVLPFEWRLNFN